MKDTFLFLKLFFLGSITLVCFVSGFFILYNFIDNLKNVNLEAYTSFASIRYLVFLLGINVVFFLIPLLLSFFFFTQLRKIYRSLSQ